MFGRSKNAEKLNRKRKSILNRPAWEGLEKRELMAQDTAQAANLVEPNRPAFISMDTNAFTALRANFGQQTDQGASAGDFNGDGIVGVPDFVFLRNHFGETLATEFPLQLEADVRFEGVEDHTFQGALTVSGPSDQIRFALIDGPEHGVLHLAADGTFTYQPNEHFFGADSFTYVLNDGVRESNKGRVTIELAGENDAPTLAAIDKQVVPFGNQQSVIVLNAQDPDGDPLSYSISAEGAMFSLEGNVLTVRPTNTQGGSITVNVTDGAFKASQSFAVVAQGPESSDEYLQKVLQELKSGVADGGFLDAYGYLVHRHVSDGQAVADGQGDATLFTAVGAAAAVLHGEQDLALRLINTIREHSWQEGKPVRHPEVFSYIDQGIGQPRQRVHRTLTGDSLNGIMLAAFYANKYGSAEVRAAAVAMFTEFHNYLLEHQFQLTDGVTAAEQLGREYKFPTGNETHKLKGAESFTLMPGQRVAWLNVAAEMGIPHSRILIPDALMGLEATVAQWGVDAAAEIMGLLVDRVLNELEKPLEQLAKATTVEVDLNKIFNIDERIAQIPAAKFNVRLSFNRTAIVNAVKTATRELGRTVNFATLDSRGLFDRILSGAMDALPDTLFGKYEWKSALVGNLQQVLPYLTGQVLVEAGWTLATLEGYRSTIAGKGADVEDYFVNHLTFLSTAALFEARPELADMLSPFVKRLTEASEQHRPGLWYWLNGNTAQVNDLLTGFEQDRRWDAESYVWETNRKSQDERILGSDGNAASGDITHSRLDYLLLKGLAKGDPPSAFSNHNEDLLEHWKRMVADAYHKFLNGLKREFENAGEYIKEWVDDAGRWVKERWTAGGEYIKRIGSNASEYVEDRWNAAGKHVREEWQRSVKVAEHVWENGTKTLEKKWNTAGEAVSSYWKSGEKFIYQEYQNGKAVLERQWQDGKKIVEAAWENGVNTLYKKWNTAGEAVSSYWKSGEKFIYQEYQNGRAVLERQWKNNVKIIEGTWKDGVNTLYKRWSDSGAKISSYWKDGARTFYQEFRNGKVVLERAWENGQQLWARTWDESGKFLGNLGNKITDGLSKLDPTTWRF